MTDLSELPLRAELRDAEPYGAPQLPVAVRLNTNENPYPPGDAVVADIAAAVAEAARTLNRYPDREAAALRADLAGYLGAEATVPLSGRNIWAANGSNEVMQHILQAFGGPGRTALSFAPTYSMYPEYARDTHTRWVAGRRAEDFTIELGAALTRIVEQRPSVILVASPNNPTGTALSLPEIEAIYDATAGMLVIDEAYAEFRRAGTASALTLLPDRPRLIVTRTMSKAFALAGARLGYLAADPAVVDALRIVRLPYHLSATTQAVARAALAHAAELLSRVDELRAERDRTVGWLRARGLRAADSDANFVLFGEFRAAGPGGSASSPDAHGVWQGLLDRGVLIREVGPDGWLRVSIGTPEQMGAFRRALEEVIGAHGR